jgi:hypothetical protein
VAKKRSAHLTRVMIEGISNYSAYKGGRLLYQKDYDPNPNINIDLITKIDLTRAMDMLHEAGDLSAQEMLMLKYVMLDGRLSRRDISAMIEKELGYFVDQRTISRRLDSAYQKIAKFLGFEYQDSKLFRMIAKKGAPKLEIPPRGYPYILNDAEVEKVISVMERT